MTVKWEMPRLRPFRPLKRVFFVVILSSRGETALTNQIMTAAAGEGNCSGT